MIELKQKNVTITIVFHSHSHCLLLQCTFDPVQTKAAQMLEKRTGLLGNNIEKLDRNHPTEKKQFDK